MDLQVNKNFLFNQPVRQLDKTPCPTLKVSKNKTFDVGRQQKQTSHVRASEPAPDFKAVNYLNGLFAKLLPDVKVCYHNPLYVQQIEKTYCTKESQLFLSFVKTFAQFRKADEFAQSKGVILT